MLLTIDVGNTNMVFGIFKGDSLEGSFRLETNADRTSDEIGIMMCQYFLRFGIATEELEAVVVASVVPQVMYSLTNSIKKYLGLTPIIIDDDIPAGLKYESDERLGADRSVTSVAAIEKYGAPVIVLDFGTATTADAIDENGYYLGGTIAAGLKIGMNALVSRTSMLPRVELAFPEHIIGTSTVEQIQAGMVGGYVGSMEYIIRKMKQEMGRPDAIVVATGGLARLVSDNTDEINVVDPQLTLDGLRIIYDRSKK